MDQNATAHIAHFVPAAVTISNGDNRACRDARANAWAIYYPGARSEHAWPDAWAGNIVHHCLFLRCLSVPLWPRRPFLDCVQYRQERLFIKFLSTLPSPSALSSLPLISPLSPPMLSAQGIMVLRQFNPGLSTRLLHLEPPSPSLHLGSSTCRLHNGSSPPLAPPGTIVPTAPLGFLVLLPQPWSVIVLPLPWIYGPLSFTHPSTPLAPSGSTFPPAPPQSSGTPAPPQYAGTLALPWPFAPTALPWFSGPSVSPSASSQSVVPLVLSAKPPHGSSLPHLRCGLTS